MINNIRERRYLPQVPVSKIFLPWRGTALPLRSTALVIAIVGCVQQGAAQSQAPARSAAAAAPFALTGATIIDVVGGRTLPDQTIVIVGNRIHAVGPSGKTALSPGTQTVDVQGKYVLPGLWDMHTHVSIMAPGVFPAMIANGVTGIRDMGQTVGTLDHLSQWRREIASGTLAGPRIIGTGGTIVADNSNRWDRGVTAPEDVRHVVDSFKAAGADFIKIHSPDLSREVYFAIAAESRRAGIPFVGHLPRAITVAEASDSGQRSIEHGNEIRLPCWRPASDSGSQSSSEANAAECAAHAAQFIRNGTWFTPTIGILYSYAVFVGEHAGDDGKRLVGESYRAGVPMLAGSDLTRPPALTDELKLMVEAGMSPLDALRAATLNPAKFFGATDSLGTVASGKVADLIVLDADPLQDIGNTTKLRAVIANGRYYDRPALDNLLAEAERTAPALLPDTEEAEP